MRYILLASITTLAVVAGLLALPSTGEPHAKLITQPVAERLALAAEDELALQFQARQLTDPSDPRIRLPTTTDVQLAAGAPVAAPTEVPNADLERGEQDESDEIADGETVLRADVEGDIEEAAPAEVETTTSTTSTSTSTSTTSTTTTTTIAPEDIPDSGGVLISPTGVVLPVIGRGSAGWRAMTPCGVEVSLESGTRILTTDFVIDAGHGGSESGAVGYNDATEKRLNLRVAEIVQWYLEREGYSVVLTRTTDIRLPLKSRAEIANALDPLAFVSIHHNGGATRVQSTPGTEVFVDGGNPDARRLGGILFEEMGRRFAGYEAEWVGTDRHGVSTRLNDEGADLYGIHRYTPGVPSVITEVGYLSNTSEADLYVQNDVQWEHGRAIADGLMRWDRTGDDGSGYLPDFVDGSSSGTGGFDGCTDPALY